MERKHEELEMIEEMNLSEVEARLAEIDAAVESAESPIDGLMEEKRSLLERKAELAEIEQRKLAAEALTEGAVQPEKIIEVVETKGKKEMSEIETRAAEFAANKKTEVRAILSTGTIAKPTQVGGINGIADLNSTIVDDVTAVALTGHGSYVVAYQDAAAAAAAVTDGSAIAGTEASFKTVTINPSEWGIVGQISRQVAKVSPLNYLTAVENASLLALRAYAENVIFTALSNSTLATAKGSLALDADYLRTVVLGFNAIDGKGATKLYLNQADLLVLGKVRGTNEKKPLYEITFDEGSSTSGTISEGGLAVRFSVSAKVAAGTQYFGQPKTIEMPMWDDMELTTDESRYFELNMIGYRGIQTAGADLCAAGGMMKITQ